MSREPDVIRTLTPEDDRTPFAKYQDEFDHSRWQGRGIDCVLPGGGNNPKGSGVKPGD